MGRSRHADGNRPLNPVVLGSLRLLLIEAMKTIGHRELRNNTSRILDEVKNGEIIQVTNHGVVVAIMIPPGLGRYEVMKLAGAIHPRRSDASFGSLPRVASTETIAEMLDDLRGDR